MAACNRLRKMGPVCHLEGCTRTRVRPHQGAAAPWVGPPSHRLRVVGLAVGLDLSRGYDQAQFCVIRAFLYFLGLRISEYVFWYFVLSLWYGTFSLVAL